MPTPSNQKNNNWCPKCSNFVCTCYSISSEKNHSEGEEKCCPKCSEGAVKDGEMFYQCVNGDCPCHSISSEQPTIAEQRMLEEFDKQFEQREIEGRGKEDTWYGDAPTPQELKAFISASLRTHTREKMERLKEAVLKITPAHATREYRDTDKMRDDFIALLTEEIKKLQ